MIKVTILGNNSALPAFDRHPTAQTIEIREQVFLMDCGEGTQSRMSRFGIHWGHIEHIFISHLHGDHYFGLIGLLSSMALWSRKKPLTIYGPSLLKDIINLQLNAVGARLPYPIDFYIIESEYAGELLSTDSYSVSCFPVNHGIPCHGFLFREKSAGRKINPDACRNYGIPQAYFHELKKGADYEDKQGKLIKNEEVTLAAPPEKIYTYCADTRYDPSILPFIQNANLIYHESTFLRDNEERAFLRHHSTAEQAARIALQACAEKLILGHYSSRYQNILPFEEEAKTIFLNSEASVEGRSYIIS